LQSGGRFSTKRVLFGVTSSFVCPSDVVPFDIGCLLVGRFVDESGAFLLLDFFFFSS